MQSECTKLSRKNQQPDGSFWPTKQLMWFYAAYGGSACLIYLLTFGHIYYQTLWTAVLAILCSIAVFQVQQIISWVVWRLMSRKEDRVKEDVYRVMFDQNPSFEFCARLLGLGVTDKVRDTHVRMHAKDVEVNVYTMGEAPQLEHLRGFTSKTICKHNPQYTYYQFVLPWDQVTKDDLIYGLQRLAVKDPSPEDKWMTSYKAEALQG